MDHQVQEAEAGRTVASLLHAHGGVSHRIARGIIEAGLLSLDGVPVTDPAQRVEAGVLVTSCFDPDTRYAPARRRRVATRWYRVLHEDADLIVVDKSPGIATVPVGQKRGRSLVERLLEAQSPEARSRGLWVVHRIDRYASGLVVVARRKAALGKLKEQFASRTVLREYLALVEGAPSSPRGRLTSWLEGDPRTRKVRVATASGEGREAVLDYEVVERMRRACRVEVRLETGRRNQIRVQFAEIGCPLVGDVTYGRRSHLISRVALHAARLRFDHPGSGRSSEFACDPPADFVAALRRLREGAHPAGGLDGPPPAAGGSGPG